MANEILHFCGYTIRVVGSGNLRATFKGFDSVLTETLVPITITSTSKKEFTRLGNFKSQRALLRLEVTGLDEWFKVNNKTIWIKQLWTQYPE